MLYSGNTGKLLTFRFFDPRKGEGYKCLNLLYINIPIYLISYWGYEIQLFTEVLPNIKNYTEKEMPNKSIIAGKRNYRVKIVEDANLHYSHVVVSGR
jgi:hypothetical protein